MNFVVRPEISLCKSVAVFLQSLTIGRADLVVSNEIIIKPYLELLTNGSGLLLTEKYGSGEPSNDMLNAMIHDIEGKDYKRVIAIGGGAVLDIAKQLLFEDGMTCEDLYVNVADLAKYKRRELIAIPTTCGTGSEVTSISVTLFPEKKTKIGLVTPAIAPDRAVLIPELLESMPYDVFAASSVDALIHAVESFVSPKATVFSKLFSKEAIALILNGYKKIVDEKLEPMALMEDFVVASTYAGIAFSNAGCGGVHALSFPLGGSFHIPHGKSNYYLFLAVFHTYVEKGADLSELEELMAKKLGDGGVWKNLENLLEAILPMVPLSELGVKESDVAAFVPAVLQNQQRLLVNMPIALDQESLKGIYMRCL
ncbi:MAG: iron-containing alcohol dehydrogenase [Lachnospiraceae bacterium]|nr:iron-containing alcohol dehydrogenase [Lachnospiraceae bacterium]